jgi:hypothetical protein
MWRRCLLIFWCKQTFQVEIYCKVIGEIRHEIFSYNKIQMGDHSIWRNVSRDNIYDSINSMYDYQKNQETPSSHQWKLLKTTWKMTVVDSCLSYCLFSLGHCVVCSSSIYFFWLPFGIFKLFSLLCFILSAFYLLDKNYIEHVVNLSERKTNNYYSLKKSQ